MPARKSVTLGNTAHLPARIVSFKEFDTLRPKLGRIVCTSGGFDPIHPGHVSCINESAKFGDTVVVVVNGDDFLKNKKGKAFMDLKTRCSIVAHIIGVDYVIPFEITNDHTVVKALERIKPHVFTKGGDRIAGKTTSDGKTIPEWDYCERNNVEMIFGVGWNKEWSSSDFLREWGEFWKQRPGK